MKIGWYVLKATARIPKWVFWPLFIGVFSYLFFVAGPISYKAEPDLTMARFWTSVFREYAAASDVDMGEVGLVVLFLAFGTLIIATFSFIAAWVPVAIVGAIVSPILHSKTIKEERGGASSLGTNRRLVSLVTAILVGIMIPFFWERLQYEPIRKLVWPVEEVALFLSFATLYLLASLLLCLIYRRYQPFVRWEGIIVFGYVGLCLAIGIPLSMEKCELRKRMQADLECMKDRMDRETARMKAVYSASETNDVQATAFALEEPTQRWRYSLMDRDGNATFDMDGVTIVFVGIKCGSTSSGSIQISGSGYGFSSSGTGSRKFSEFYRNGVAVFTFAGHTCKLKDRGTVLVVDGQEFALAGGKPKLLVSPDGSIQIQDMAGKEKPKKAPEATR